MIGLIIKNNLCKSAFLDLLEPFGVEVYQPGHSYDALVLTDDAAPETVKDIPIISVGPAIKGEFYHIDIPVRPADLVHHIQSALARLTHRTVFENADFVFRAIDRSLRIKESDTLIQLTEKESDLLSALADAFPNPLDKETLLKQVWNYRPDTETHTLESHIYTLRQKIGPKADSLIQSTPTGYTLIPLPPK